MTKHRTQRSTVEHAGLRQLWQGRLQLWLVNYTGLMGQLLQLFRYYELELPARIRACKYPLSKLELPPYGRKYPANRVKIAFTYPVIRGPEQALPPQTPPAAPRTCLCPLSRRKQPRKRLRRSSPSKSEAGMVGLSLFIDETGRLILWSPDYWHDHCWLGL
jgi:hypothetical protein